MIMVPHIVAAFATHGFIDVHNPPGGLAAKLGYPRPLVDHHDARQRAIKRYKVPGQE